MGTGAMRSQDGRPSTDEVLRPDGGYLSVAKLRLEVIDGNDAGAARVFGRERIVIGSHDQMTPPRASLELLENIRHARSVTLDGSGHSLMAEAPDAVLDALIGFLQPAAQA